MKRVLVAASALILLAVLAWVWRQEIIAPAEKTTADRPEAGSPANTNTSAPAAGSRAEPESRHLETEAASGRPRWVVVGSVVDTQGAPIARPSVQVFGGGDVGWEPLQVATGDAAGRFRFELQISKRPDALRVVATAPGYLKALTRIELFTEAPLAVPLEVRLELEAGAWLSGRVLDADGRPVPKVGIVLYQLRENELTTIAGGADTDDRGECQVGFREAGRYLLWVIKDNAGCRRLEDLILDPVTSSRAPDVVLGGTGVIEGRVVDGRSLPLADVGLELTSMATRDEPAQDLPGLTHARSRSGADGRFRFAALRQGRYALRPEPSAVSELVHEARTGERDVQITITAHRLRISVNAEGLGKRMQSVSCSGWGASRAADIPESRPARWPLGEPSHDWNLGGLTGSEGELLLFVPPGSAWDLSCRRNGFQPAEAFVRIPNDGLETSCELVLRPFAKPGRLSVHVHGEGGGPIRSYWLHISEPGRPRGLFFMNVDGQVGPLAGVPLPAGRFTVSVNPNVNSATFLNASRDVEIFAAQDAALDIELQLGGRLRMTLALPASLRDRGADLTCTLTPRGGGSPVRVDRWLEPRTQDQAHELADGVPYLARFPLVSGIYDMRVEAPGCAPEVRMVQIDAGRTTEVRVALLPR